MTCRGSSTRSISPALPEQRTTWGLADVNVHEVPLRDRIDTRSGARLSST